MGDEQIAQSMDAPSFSAGEGGLEQMSAEMAAQAGASASGSKSVSTDILLNSRRIGTGDEDGDPPLA